MISAFIGEFGITVAFGLSCAFLFEINEYTLNAIEATIFIVIIASISGQLFLSLFLIVESVQEIWKKIVRNSMKAFLSNVRTVTDANISMETVDVPEKKNDCEVSVMDN